MKFGLKGILFPTFCLTIGTFGGYCIGLHRGVKSVGQGLSSVQAGDWVQSIAGVTGVALTVWATMWLEDRKRKKDAREDQLLLSEAVYTFHVSALKALMPMNDADELVVRRIFTLTHYEMLRIGRDSMSHARASYRIRNVQIWNAFDRLDQIIAEYRTHLVREERILREENVTETVLAISRERLIAFANAVRDPLDVARRAIGNIE